MRALPLTLEQANNLVAQWHRHHKPVRGHRFSIGAFKAGRLCGAAIIGRPVARMIPPYEVAEVTRLVTDGTKNACSYLYAASARIAREMGFWKIQTYILDDETGVTLRAAGWEIEDGEFGGGDWNRGQESTHKNRRTDQPMNPKKRAFKILNDRVTLGAA